MPAVSARSVDEHVVHASEGLLAPDRQDSLGHQDREASEEAGQRHGAERPTIGLLLASELSASVLTSDLAAFSTVTPVDAVGNAVWAFSKPRWARSWRRRRRPRPWADRRRETCPAVACPVRGCSARTNAGAPSRSIPYSCGVCAESVDGNEEDIWMSDTPPHYGAAADGSEERHRSRRGDSPRTHYGGRAPLRACGPDE